MFWDNVAGVYDIFANIINRKTHRGLCAKVENEISITDEVLECACGTGLLSGVIAEKCNSLIATDFSVKMLKKASKKYHAYTNIEFRKGNILQIEYPDEKFDVVVAANVIHLLDEPLRALEEMDLSGKSYFLDVSLEEAETSIRASLKDAARSVIAVGHYLKVIRDKELYREAGYENVEYSLIEGKIPCAIAVITKK